MFLCCVSEIIFLHLHPKAKINIIHFYLRVKRLSTYKLQYKK